MGASALEGTQVGQGTWVPDPLAQLESIPTVPLRMELENPSVFVQAWVSDIGIGRDYQGRFRVVHGREEV